MEQRRVRVLCVEDNVDTSEILKIWLGYSGYEYVPALTYADGLAKALQDDFDALILDNRLPDGRGVDLCRQFRRSNSETPIIFYSADAQKCVREEAFEAGANEYLIKPVNLSDVVRSIEKHLRPEVHKQPVLNRPYPPLALQDFSKLINK
jgi:DNA-binding response OmpR family regulator